MTHNARSLPEKLARAKDIYAQWDIQNQMKDGDLSYPRIDDKWEAESTGMELEFRYAQISLLCKFKFKANYIVEMSVLSTQKQKNLFWKVSLSRSNLDSWLSLLV